MNNFNGTLLSDSLEQVKASLLIAIKSLLTEAYPKEFGDYKTSKGDVYTKVFWSDTVRYQPDYPYCIITPQKDLHEGLDETIYFRREDGQYVKRITSRSLLTISIDVCDMGNEANIKSSLQADSFSHKVARQLRKYFNGDEMLDWFSGNEYYPRQLDITVDSEISATLNWEDTDTVFRYSFDLSIGWNDVVDIPTEPAKGIYVNIYEKDKKIDDFTITLQKGE